MVQDGREHGRYPGMTVGLPRSIQLHGIVSYEAWHDDELGPSDTAKFITAVMANT
mgnify:CR=1 FL=1